MPQQRYSGRFLRSRRIGCRQGWTCRRTGSSTIRTPSVRSRWRWGVFDGSIKPDNYNTAWWALKKKYQGVAPSVARGEENFDPGAKYHVPGNTPYMRYFLAHILQFQFQRELCKAAGYKGPLHECSIYGNKAAGAKFWAMLQKGSSQPWQETLKELTGKGEMDATAILDYFDEKVIAPHKQELDAQADEPPRPGL